MFALCSHRKNIRKCSADEIAELKILRPKHWDRDLPIESTPKRKQAKLESGLATGI
jgi:hypothetical protein